jgi:hypothetical protein
MMENQHRKISGYRELNQQEIDAMNSIKEAATDIGNLVEQISQVSGVDQRWLSIARTDLQKGFMSFVRAVAQPTTF